jgi:metallo-beta-lactamase family protein
LAGKLKNGDTRVRIFGDEFNVNAEVKHLGYYSAHGDYSEMIKWLACQNKKKIKEVFLVHGELKTQLSFKEKLEQVGFHNISIPHTGEGVVLTMP